MCIHIPCDACLAAQPAKFWRVSPLDSKKYWGFWSENLSHAKAMSTPPSLTRHFPPNFPGVIVCTRNSTTAVVVKQMTCRPGCAPTLASLLCRYFCVPNWRRIGETFRCRLCIFGTTRAQRIFLTRGRTKSHALHSCVCFVPIRTNRDRQVLFEITGGGTVSEEEEEEKHDPQWTRYRRQQAAARKGASGGGGGGGDRHRRGAWTAAAQRCGPFQIVEYARGLDYRHEPRTQQEVSGGGGCGSSGALRPGGVIFFNI